jgi:hypothetical protein
VKGTWTATPYRASETAAGASTPTPVNQQVGADPNQLTELSSANAGVALTSYGSGLTMALTGLLATVLAF